MENFGRGLVGYFISTDTHARWESLAVGARGSAREFPGFPRTMQHSTIDRGECCIVRHTPQSNISNRISSLIKIHVTFIVNLYARRFDSKISIEE